MKMSKETKIILAVAVAAILISVVAIGIAVTIITAPEHVIGIPQDPEPTPTPTPTPGSVALHLTSNNTDPFYKGDYLTMIATLTPSQADVTVNLYNNGDWITNATTDASGVATITRQPFKAFDYTVTAELP
jgi:hypothetical protein